MSDLLDDLYLSPDEDAQEEPVNFDDTENVCENVEIADNSGEATVEADNQDQTFVSTSNLDKFNESFKKEAEFWGNLSDTVDEEDFEKSVNDILNKEKFRLFDESFKKQAEVWNTLSLSLDDENFEKHIEEEILNEPFEIFQRNDEELFESLFQNGDNFWRKVKDCLTEEEFERLVQNYIESEDITWKKLTTEAFESITQPPPGKTRDATSELSDQAMVKTDDNYPDTKSIQDRKMKSKSLREVKREMSPKRELVEENIMEEPKRKKLNTSNSIFLPSNSKKIVEFDMFEKEAHRCKKCPSLFNSFKELKIHMQIHEKPENVKPFICDLCPKSFKVSNQLRLHKEFNHSVNKPLTCNFCNRPFKQFDVLQKHRRRHYA